MADGQVLLEAGVLAYRHSHGEVEILLVSKKRSKKWGIPKGRVEPHLSFGELASKEAFEEAGVPADSYGVGSSLFAGRFDFTADIVLTYWAADVAGWLK